MSEPSRASTWPDLLGRLRIGPKLLLAPAVALLLLLASSAAAHWALVRQNRSLESIVQVRDVRIRDATELVAEAQSAHARLYQLLTWMSGSFAPSRIDTLAADIGRRHDAIGARLASLAARCAAGSAEQRLLEDARAAHGLYRRALSEVIELSRADQAIGASAMQKPERAFATVALRLQALAQLERNLSEAASQQAAGEFRTVSTVMPLLAALSVLLSLALTMAVRRSLLRQVRGIGAAAHDLASGNLTVPERDYGGDEIADAARTLDASIGNLNATLKGILDTARLIDSTSRDVAAGNADLSHRAGAQASSIEQTTASMRALSDTVNRTADTAHAANRLAASASMIAREGGGVVGQLGQTMTAIRRSSSRVMQLLERLDGMASQSGTLAFNGAMEAARAGQQGAAFAAVAADVRMLAQQSSGVLGEMRELVTQSIAQIDGASMAAEQTGDSLAGIASSVREVGDMIERISRASAVQADGISDVNTAIVQMDQMSQHHSAMVQQAAAAAESLQAQAVMLSRAVAGFKLGEAVPVAGKPRLHLASKR